MWRRFWACVPCRAAVILEWGTRNALLSLGDSTYLEVIAPDPETPQPGRGRLFQQRYLESPALSAWVFRTAQLEGVVEAASNVGILLGPVLPGSRETPDGQVLRWRLTDPYSVPPDGAVPFLIDWGTTAHPARALPRAGELARFRIEHAEPERLRRLLRILDAAIEVTASPQSRLIAEISTKSGTKVLS